MSAAIQDFGLAVDRYFMLNAAVASECYDPSSFNDSVEGNLLVEPEWADYTNITWASKWHELFPATDDRSRLTWRGRFADVTDGAVYNCYSSGDEVFELKGGGVGPFSGRLRYLDRHAWQKQEMLKGTGSLGGTSWAGWGMRTHYDPWLEEFVVTYLAAEANAIAATNPSFFCATPLFWPSPSFMFTDTIPASWQNQLLACGIPALSPAIGSAEIAVLGENNMDLNDEDFRNGWSRDDSTYGQRWLHSDIKNIAYACGHKVFDKIVTIGRLQ